ncbi:MAG: hypothetical protein COA47_13640 [Robiginitomaculum sp.]|nr:MAG: hypothetical protein COA47_13640 [Robiginitomaculum sp.]
MLDEDIEKIKRDLEKQEKTEVRIALFGQPGAGKSSLINALTGSNKASVGVETDKTTKLQEIEHEGLIFCDLPGYGTTNFPKNDYFQKFNIMNFDLLLCVTSGKLRDADSEFFNAVVEEGKVCLFVHNQSDMIWEPGCSVEELRQRKAADISSHIGRKENIYFTSCRDFDMGRVADSGIGDLSEAIMHHLDTAKQERWVRGASAASEEILERKKQVCDSLVSRYAGLSAVNGINPIPGVDVAIDLASLGIMFKHIRATYGLTEERLEAYKIAGIPIVANLANNVVKYAAKEGLLLLLKQFATRQTIKSVSKYIPFVGQAIAASIGYAITSNVGASYAKDSYELASEVLKNNLKG